MQRIAFYITWCLLLLLLPVGNPDAVAASGEAVPGQLLVRYRDAGGDRMRLRIRQARRDHIEHFRLKARKRFRSGWELFGCDPARTEEVLDSLRNDPTVAHAEPDYLIYADIIPDDPHFNLQWGLHNTGQTDGIPDADIDAPEGWNITTGASDILVGVIDSGIDPEHPDLAPNIWLNPAEIPGNNIDDDNNGFIDDYHGYDFYRNDPIPDDEHGHGTHVSGTIGAVGNDSTGVAGVAWDVSLMALKFLGPDRSGPTSAAISAIEYAIDQGVDLINASWGSTTYSAALYDIIALAGDAGILFVASGGNSSLDNDKYPQYPAAYDLENIVTVASTDASDELSYFSNWGLTTVDLGAPGSSIMSTLPGGQYGYMSGTSMAAPHVTGALVLARSRWPEMTSGELKAQLLAGTEVKESLVGLTVSAGRLNTRKMLESVIAPAIELSPTSLSYGLNLVGQTSSDQICDLHNSDAESIQIDSIVAGDGFYIYQNGELLEKTENVVVAGGETYSVAVVFRPVVAGMFRQLLSVFHRSGGDATYTQVIQLVGRAVTGTIVDPGPVSGIWQRSSAPYYITGDIGVNSGQVLVIEAGVKVEFQDHYRFTVYENAVLEARGTSEDSIVFSPYEIRAPWFGLRFLNSGSDDLLQYCRIENARKQNGAELLEDQRGGGIFISGSSPRLENCVITGNYAQSGGGISCLEANPELSAVTVSDNVAGSDGGAGISCYDSDPLLQNVLIVNNRTNYWLSGDNGGALYCRGSSPRLINATISGNRADKGGALYISQSGSHPTIVNSILWGNIPEEICFSEDPKSKSVAIAHSDVEEGENAIIKNSAGDVFWLTGNLNTDPAFLSIENGDFRLLYDSPCIDTGIQDTSLLYNDDQDNLIVPQISFEGSGVDMGCYESDGLVRKTYQLVSGWNLLSWNQETRYPAVEDHFDDLLGDVVLILGFENGGLTFDPSVDMSFNTLRQVNELHGYWIKLLQNRDLIVTGGYAEVQAPVYLDAGWNLVGYLPQTGDSIKHALESIIGRVSIVEGFDQAALTYVPDLPEEINTLHVMQPGYGYWIKLTLPDTLIYPDHSVAGSVAARLLDANEGALPEENIQTTPQWISICATDLNVDDQPIASGTKIRIKDPDGVTCGAGVVSEAGKVALIPVYCDDASTDPDEGVREGDSLYITIGEGGSEIELAVKMAGRIINLSEIITNIRSADAMKIPLTYQIGQNYPNPFNQTCLIRYQIAHPGLVDLSIYDILGQKVKTLIREFQSQGAYEFRWDGTNASGQEVASGLYLYRIQSGDFCQVRKMVLMR